MNFWLLSDLINLSFSDLPSVSLKMSSTLDGDLIRKGDTVYLQCEVKANPSVHTIHWTFEVGGMEQFQGQLRKEVYANCKIVSTYI